MFSRQHQSWITRCARLALFALAGAVIAAAAPGLGADKSESAGRTPSERPASWARPLSKPGLPNLHQVNPTLYRGAQPDREGFRELEKLGVLTVVNLRDAHSDRDLLKGLNLRYEEIPATPLSLNRDDAVAFLKIAADPSRQPVFVHCLHGADRTGAMCAIYRIAVQGWTKDEALREMKDGGFGFHSIWSRLLTFVRGLDIEQVKLDAGLTQPALSVQ